jgi:hypothetical protein
MNKSIITILALTTIIATCAYYYSQESKKTSNDVPAHIVDLYSSW